MELPRRPAPFFLKPSTATWFLPVLAKKCRTSLQDADAAFDPGVPARFRFLPSVGTWLLLKSREQDQPVEWPTSQCTAFGQAEFEANFADFEFDPNISARPAPIFTSAVNVAADRSASIGSMFKLAPPPSPAAVVAVGGVVPAAEVILLDEDVRTTKLAMLEEEISPLSVTHEELLGTNRADDDDEDALLGDDGAPINVMRRKTLADDVDSPSESELEVAGAGSSDRSPAGASPSRQRMTPPKPAEPEVTNAFLPPNRAPAGSQVPRASSQLTAAYAAQAESKSDTPAQARPANQNQQQSPQGASPQAQAPTTPGGSLFDIDSMVGAALDRFFGDHRVWPQVEQEVENSKRNQGAGHRDQNNCERRFRVQVPSPYPGVQYRRSKRIDDRYKRYAENNCIVSGFVEDDGEWLRVFPGKDVFLPMRVGAVEILEPLPPLPRSPDAGRGPSNWFSCCSATATADAELVIGQAAEGGNQEQGGSSSGMHAAQAREGAAGLGTGTAEFPYPAPPDPGPSQGEHAVPAGTPHAARASLSPNSNTGDFSLSATDSPRPRLLPESTCRDQLPNIDATSRLNDPINPFTDTDRASSTDRFDRRFLSAPRQSTSSPFRRDSSIQNSQGTLEKEVFMS